MSRDKRATICVLLVGFTYGCGIALGMNIHNIPICIVCTVLVVISNSIIIQIAGR